MTSDQSTISFKRLWLIAAIFGVISAPLALFADKAPWVIAIPIVAGVMFLGLLEFAAGLNRDSLQLPLLKSPKDFFGLARYKGHVALTDLVEKETPGQGMFDFVTAPRRTAVKSARIIRDPETGERIYLIDTERFVALLLKQYLASVDKVTEVSLIHALHRYGEMNTMSGDLERFLRDKTVIEVIRTDFRGNAAQTINRASEAAIRDAIKQVQDTKQQQLATMRG